jgi:hypothetical protein
VRFKTLRKNNPRRAAVSVYILLFLCCLRLLISRDGEDYVYSVDAGLLPDFPVIAVFGATKSVRLFECLWDLFWSQICPRGELDTDNGKVYFIAFGLSVVTRPFEPFFPLLSTPTPSARFRLLTVGRGWPWLPRIRSVDPFEFCLVAWHGLDIYTALMRINY